MKQVTVVAISTLLVLLLTAGTVLSIPRAGALYLRVAPGARPAGMGEAFVSIADDATATFWNPAGLGNAPLAGMLKTFLISQDLPGVTGNPDQPAEISAAVTLRGMSGNTETWVIIDNKLIRFDGNQWHTGTEYETSADQTLPTFLKTIINIEDDTALQAMATQVIEVNCPVKAAEVDTFISAVQSVIPEGYGAKEELETGLENIRTGYAGCLLLAPQFRDLQRKLAEGMKDETLSAEELDRVTYSLDRAVGRYLPQRLTVPYGAGIAAPMTCLGATGKYLWVGTTDGLYRLAGVTWAVYTVNDGLASNVITTMANYDENLLIGTDLGLVQYFHGAFSGFANLPGEKVSALVFRSRDLAYAAVGGIVYRYDGKVWSDSQPYTVRIDDSLEKLISRLAIYHTADEYTYLEKRLMELNRPAPTATPAAAGDSTTTATADSTAVGASAPDIAATTPGDSLTPADTGSAEASVVDINQWLAEGHIIQLPLSPKIRYDVTALAVDLDSTLWVGTTSGLLSCVRSEWTRHGYTRYVVPAGDSVNPGAAMTAIDIAKAFLPNGDSTKTALLAETIDRYNELNGAPVAPGGEVYIYSANIGSSIRSLGLVFGELCVGTAYGLEKWSGDGWQEVKMEGLDRKQIIAANDFEGQSYYITQAGLTSETKGQKEAVFMHVKWLPSLDLDIYYEFFSYVQPMRGIGTFGISAIFLTYGSIEYTDEIGTVIGEGHPVELALALSYGTSLTSKLKWGMTGKFIHSRLSDQGVGQEQGEGIASGFAVDMGILYQFTKRLQLGVAITNIGPDITYIDAAQHDPLPRNLGVGLSYKILNSTYNRLIVQVEANKIMTDLNNGIGRELENAIRHIGAEYWYANLIALRGGYLYDKEGKVKHLTFGSGLQLAGMRLDFAYVPSSTDSPLANTLRISATAKF